MAAKVNAAASDMQVLSNMAAKRLQRQLDRGESLTGFRRTFTLAATPPKCLRGTK
jgi:hypothetical protein